MASPASLATATCPVCGRANGCVAAGDAACWCDDVAPDPAIQRLASERDFGDLCLCRRCLTGRVPSPCVGICRLDDAGERCVGCLRTLSEVTAWGRLDPGERASVLLRTRRTGTDGAAS